MRLIYLDEAGISNPAQEPIMTVAGVVVHGDRQYKAIESHLDRLVSKYVPKAPLGFSFHAFHLFNGVKTFDKKSWPLDLRLETLDALAEIPKQFDLPVCHSSVDREAAKQLAENEGSLAHAEFVNHATSLFYCALQVEILLRDNTDEVAILIAEDREQLRRMLKFVHAVFRGRCDPGWKQNFLSAIELPFVKYVPLERIVENIQFAEKNESSLLQVADVCAFAIKRKLMKKPYADRLFKPISDQFILGKIRIGFGPKVQGVALEEESS